MRRTTAWALGGMLAGTVLLGTGGTMATFSDTESVAATVGAGRLALPDPTPSGQGSQSLRVGSTAALLPVQPDVVGSGTAQLRLWAVDTHRQDPCSTDLLLTVTQVEPAVEVTASLCTLARKGADLLTVDSTSPSLALNVTAALPPDADPAARQWRGDLRLVLGQTDHGGFSDEQWIPVHVVEPNPQSANGKGNGNSGEQTGRSPGAAITSAGGD